MNRIVPRLALILMVILLLPLSGLSQRNVKPKEKRLALVIGNGAYKKDPLRNPVNDAHDMAAALGNLGFDVMHIQNADRKQMKLSIRDFGRRLRKNGGVGLFYFAGHGIQVDGRNYLIPVDAAIETESDVEFEAVDAGRILGKMEDAENHLNIVILDACRDNPFKRSFRTGHRGLAKMDAPIGSLVAYATAPGSIAADGTGRNGVYTKYLMKHMHAQGLKVEEVLKRVRTDVMAETANQQVPWESSSLTGEFYFIPREEVSVTKKPKASTTATAPQPSTVMKTQETVFWESIKNSRDPAFFEEYLRKFPNGTFSGLAKLKIAHLQEKRKLEKAKPTTAQKGETEKETIETAKLPSELEVKPKLKTESQPKEGIKDERFMALSNGIVKDTKTGLEWIAGPDNDTYWKEVNKWVKGLTIDGGGWRIPTLTELETLYEHGKGQRNLTPLLRTSGWIVWAKADEWNNPGYFHFSAGNGRAEPDPQWVDRIYIDRRAFAVRSQKTKDKMTEKPRVEMASLSQDEASQAPSSGLEETAREGRFIKYTNGIVYDPKTNLEWFVGPDEDTSFFEAKEWVEDLTIGGGKWRLPSVKELKSLSQRRGGVTTIHPFFMTNGKSIWASNQWTADLYIINRNRPAEFLIESFLTKSVFIRAFAVRSRK